MPQETVINTPEEQDLRAKLEARTDAEAARMRRFLAMPDLTRTPGSPLKELVARMTADPDFKDFEFVKVPEIVPASIAFDLFDFAPDHVARSKSDTYYVDDDHILRPHTTVMWYYYLTSERIKERMARGEAIGVFCHGKVYRKDEIDRSHMNVFHQIDGLYLVPKDQKEITLKDLQDVEVKMVNSVFGNVEHRFADETFPYTHPSTEVEIKKGDNWLEILGSGVVKGSVLEKLGVDSSKYNGWALGSGLERWAMISMELPDIRLLWSDDPRVTGQMKLGHKFKEVSKYPPITRDISFIVKSDFVANDYFDLIRDIVGDLIEEVQLLDKYENEAKFGKDRVSYTYRIVYRRPDRTLTNEEVEPLQSRLYSETKEKYGAELR